jgi:hypothetical protein
MAYSGEIREAVLFLFIRASSFSGTKEVLQIASFTAVGNFHG